MANLMLNRVELCGRLAADPELKATASGVPCTEIVVAVQRRYKNSAGERDTDFFRMDLYRHHAEFVCRYFKKGNSIHIDGELRMDSRLNPVSGNRRWVMEIVVSDVRPVDSRKKESDGSFDVDDFFKAALAHSYAVTGGGKENEDGKE